MSLETKGGPINIHEYYYLQGDKEYWPGWGAAFGVVQDWCKGSGYGGFGTPTERGKAAMETYVRQTQPSD